MHLKGFSHNDIKLHNILLFRKGGENAKSHCKLTDFGLSRVNFIKDKGIILKRNYCGTRGYMSPEILENEDHTVQYWYDPFACDVYALGICLFAMAFRAYPYRGEEAKTLLAQAKRMRINFNQKRKNKESKEELPPIKEPMRHLIRHMLEAEPRRRITIAGIWTHEWMDIFETIRYDDTEHLKDQATDTTTQNR